MEQWRNSIYEVELMRSNITPRAFFSAAEKAMKKKGASLETWIDTFEDWTAPLQENNLYTSNEVCRTLPFRYQFYLAHTYNFILEFDFWDEKKGTGYLYAVENET